MHPVVNYFENLLVIDVKSATQFPNVADFEREQPRLYALWQKKLKRVIEENDSEAVAYLLSTSIHAEFSKIVCVSLAWTRYVDAEDPNSECKVHSMSFINNNEQELLIKLFDVLDKYLAKKPEAKIAGHGIKIFDIPLLHRRCLINGLTIHKILDMTGLKPWDTKLIDSVDRWKLGTYEGISEELFAEVLGVGDDEPRTENMLLNSLYWNEGVKTIGKISEADAQKAMRILLKIDNL